MSIIRQIQAQFAVPDLRNFGTTVRVVLISVVGILLLPLIMNSMDQYSRIVWGSLAWVAPTLLINGLTGYLVSRYLLEHKAGIWLFMVICIAEMVMVDYVVLGERIAFFQHLTLYIISLLFMMYIEANRLRSLSPALSEARLTALTARIRPHFLFNSLNAAISLIRLRPYDAETLLENLANLFRAQLRDGSQSSTLGQEIEWAQEYIAIEQIRMGPTRVQVMWHHHAPDDAETPHLLLQPLLENAVFHGVESSHRPGSITVQTAQKGHWLYIRIENPYSPKENIDQNKPHKSNSMALRNLQERLSIMYDKDAVVKLQQREEEGIFRVDIRLPYRAKASAYANPFGR